ncbi:MAG TPA: aldo/keto reductase [Spirochaetia bacterium]|nr:aldo/keto reductase [Spirochaetia bacterium]
MLPTRKLGSAGPELTVIGFGAWAIGGPWTFGWGPQDDQDSLDAIGAALDAGINWIDTAAAYGLGHSEEVVGRAITGKRDRVLIATKCGIVWNESGKVRNNIAPESIEKEIDASLKRLGTDYIDLYQIHWPDRTTPEEKAWETMLKLKEKGKTRSIGVSNFSTDMLAACEKLGHIDSLQPPYSLVKRKVEQSELSFCREHGIGVIPYSPMQSGLLTGKFNRDRLAADDWRRKSGYFNDPFLSKALQFVEELKSLAQKYEKTPAQFSIAWTLMHPSITAAIVGARNPRQVNENIGGAGFQIEPEDMKTIEELSKKILGDQIYTDL